MEPQCRKPGVLADEPGFQNLRPPSTATSDASESILAKVVGQIGHERGRLTPRQREREIARELIKLIAVSCWDTKNEMLGRVWQTIVRNNPQTEISFRRVRAIWHRETARISFSEMIELATVATHVARKERRHAPH